MYWDRPPDLYECQAVVVVHEYLLRLHVVGHVTLGVDSPSLVASAGTESTSTRDDCQPVVRRKLRGMTQNITYPSGITARDKFTIY